MEEKIDKRGEKVNRSKMLMEGTLSRRAKLVTDM